MPPSPIARAAFARCTMRPGRSSCPTPGTPARRGSSPGSAFPRSRPRAPGSRSRSVASTAGLVSRDEALAHARAIVEATDLPVSADLENGFGADPAAVAETIRRAAEAGVVGGSIEDASGDAASPDLRAVARGRARRRRGRSGAGAAVPVRARRPGRELPARPRGSRRHGGPPARVRRGGRRRALRAGAARPRRGARRLRGRRPEAGERARHRAEPRVHGGEPRRARRAPDQPRLDPRARGVRGVRHRAREIAEHGTFGFGAAARRSRRSTTGWRRVDRLAVPPAGRCASPTARRRWRR